MQRTLQDMIIEPVSVEPQTELEKLAEAINEFHAGITESENQIQSVGKKSLDLAIQCGNALRDAQKIVPRGKFDEWVEDNCPFDRRTAFNYMRLVKHISLIGDCQTIREAYVCIGVIKIKSEKPGIMGLLPVNEEPETPNDETPEAEAEQDEDESGDEDKPLTPEEKLKRKWNKFHSALCRLQDLQYETFPKKAEAELVKCGQVFVQWYVDKGGKIPVKKAEVVPVRKAA